jgi:hypothetical protein
LVYIYVKISVGCKHSIFLIKLDTNINLIFFANEEFDFIFDEYIYKLKPNGRVKIITAE